jgi:hypothetical protein
VFLVFEAEIRIVMLDMGYCGADQWIFCWSKRGCGWETVMEQQQRQKRHHGWRIDKAQTREKLQVRAQPYWLGFGKHRAVGYRKISFL